MTVHERMESLADLLVAGGLGAEERAEAEHHASGCADCAALIRDAREFAAWAKGLIRPDAPPADLEDRVIERFRAAGQSKRRRFVVGKRVLKVTGSIAAAVGLILLGNAFGREDSAVVVSDARMTSYDDASVDGASRTTGLSTEGFKNQNKSSFLGLQAMDGEGTRWKEQLEGRLAERGEDAKTRGLRSAGPEELRRELQEERGRLAVAELKYARQLADVPMSENQTADRVDLMAKQGRILHSGGKEGKNGGDTAEHWDGLVAVTPAPQGGGVAGFGRSEQSLRRPGPEPSVQENRKIIRNADVALEVDSYDATYTKLSELATAEKGFIASANTQKLANGKIQATVILRVPPERFEAVIARFKDLGTVRHQNIGSEDVTKAYIDLQSRLASKQTLAGRLSKLLAEGKGTVKELMEVEVQLGATNEAIEQIVGEIKYYDNRIGLSTITLHVAEKDLGQPFEVVQTLQANLALTVRDPDDAYVRAQKEITDAGGQVVDSRMNRQNDGSSTGTIRARVDADKFQPLREALKKLGVPTNDTVNLQKTAQGGREGAPKADAPLRKEQAVLDLSVSSPPIFVTRRSQLVVETGEVESAYQNSRKSVEGAGGKVVDGSLMGKADRMVAVLKIQADADKFGALMESLKTAGKVKTATVSSVLPTAAADGGVALLRERAEIEFTLVSPPQLIAEENGLGKSLRDTLANSWGGLLWSIEKLFVGIALAGPWILIVGVGIYLWKKSRRKKVVGSP